MIGHHASEFFAMKSLASQIADRLPLLDVTHSDQEESDF
jgi:hypothetical protein